MPAPQTTARRARALAAALIYLTVTACGGDSETSTPALDLDPGNYPTTPRDIEVERTPATGSLQESVRMAEHVALMMDLDRRLVFSNGSTSTRHYSAQHPPVLGGVTTIDDFNAQVPGLVAGWRTGGSRRAHSALGLDATLHLLRFTTPQQADHAMNLLAEKSNQKYPPKQPLDLPGHPSNRTFLSAYDAVQSWTTHGEYLMWTYVSDSLATPPDHAPLLEFTRTILDDQVRRLGSYQATPADRLAEVPADIDGLLGRTLPYPDPESYDNPTAVYPAQVFLHLDSRPDLTARAFEEAGVDLVARGDSLVYRTADADAAERLLGALVDQHTDMFPTDTPAGAPPGTSCVQESAGTPNSPRLIRTTQCYLTYDRYVGVVAATQPQDLTQRIAAQYLLLTHE
ncbi:DUF7373 family lipoprotein [Nocardia shimofusensis]|uniref:DUF7373 family lipoprotein n=1 Tax=Nocardia shimofusensis TaxID=228596 RepID=UPI0012ED15AE|nr:hypothetical protein [Nocardia shimofusensis]